MKLTEQEQLILSGREGPARQRAMEILVMYGEAMQADKLLDIESVGLTISCPYPVDRHADMVMEDYNAVFSYASLNSLEVYDIPRMSARCCSQATNPSPDYLRYLGITDENLYRGIEITNDFMKRTGINNTLSCVQYLVGDLITLGQHCSVQESSAVIFVNSVLGGRTNCYGEMIGGCAALLGKIPNAGLHRTENRRGTHLVKVEEIPKELYEWDLLGYYMGKKLGAAVPVFQIEIPCVTADMHKSFGASLCTTGSIDMYHMIGLTPEAFTYEQAFGSNKPIEVYTYGAEEKKKALQLLDYAAEEEVDFVLMGCPHYSIYQMQKIAALLEGKKTKARLIIMTTWIIKEMADRNGYSEIIEKAGGFIMTDTCPPMIHIWPEGIKVMATDSGKMAHYTPSTRSDVSIHMGSMEHCVQAAITGKW